MADALASGASVLRDVGVQVPLRPQGAVWATQRPKVRNSKGFLTFAFSSFLALEIDGSETTGLGRQDPGCCSIYCSIGAHFRLVLLRPVHVRRRIFTSDTHICSRRPTGQTPSGWPNHQSSAAEVRHARANTITNVRATVRMGRRARGVVRATRWFRIIGASTATALPAPGYPKQYKATTSDREMNKYIGMKSDADPRRILSGMSREVYAGDLIGSVSAAKDFRQARCS